MLVKLIEEAYLREAAEEQGFTDKIRAGLGKIRSGVSNAFDKASVPLTIASFTEPGALATLGAMSGAGLGAYLGIENADEINGLIDGADYYGPIAASSAALGAGLVGTGINELQKKAMHHLITKNPDKLIN